LSELSLTDLKGIGDKTAEKLKDLGYKTVESIAVLREEELAEVLGWTKMKARETINDAKEKSLSTVVPILDFDEYYDQIEKEKIHFSTGSANLDRILHGGICTGELTALRGSFSSGKTQICYTVTVNVLGKGYAVAWIEVEPGTFSTDRLREISSKKGVEIDPKKVYVVPARNISSPNVQFLSYQRIAREIEKGLDVKLLVVDSFSPKFREFYPRREMFPSRSQEIARHIGFLQSLASKYNLAVLLTAQVMGVPDTDQQKIVGMKEDSFEAVTLGHTMKHGVQTWLSLREISRVNKLYKASLIDSSYLPPGEAQFKIDENGVRDP